MTLRKTEGAALDITVQNSLWKRPWTSRKTHYTVIDKLK